MKNIVISAPFSPDGKRIVTASVDRTARIWGLATTKGIAIISIIARGALR
jgi:WD40 repeat protein